MAAKAEIPVARPALGELVIAGALAAPAALAIAVVLVAPVAWATIAVVWAVPAAWATIAVVWAAPVVIA